MMTAPRRSGVSSRGRIAAPSRLALLPTGTAHRLVLTAAYATTIRHLLLGDVVDDDVGVGVGVGVEPLRRNADCVNASRSPRVRLETLEPAQ